ETEAELTALRAAGIQLFQGYLFAKPAVASLPAVRFPASSALSTEALAQSYVA
ncbi:EAL domain-containing protein, partial [Methylobacterium sp. E-066]|nr:EAL domain-containing protein [Methylobacterium sp. E-066]